MIKIERNESPEFLRSSYMTDLNNRLEKEYLDSTRQRRLEFDPNFFKKIREDIQVDFNSKCSFCESKLENVIIDHFRPKGGARGLNINDYSKDHYWWLAYDWSNLFLVCPACSKYKRDFFPIENEKNRAKIGTKGKGLLEEKSLLIDPTLEEPSDHLDFLDNGTVVGKTMKGEVSIKILGLDRAELVLNRKKAVDELRTVIMSTLQKEKISNKLIELAKEIYNSLMEPNLQSPFLAPKRAFMFRWLRSNGLPESKLVDFLLTEYRPGIIEKSFISLGSALLRKKKEKIVNQIDALKRFSIKQIEIWNFKSIDHVKLEIKPFKEKDGMESWLLILGDNSVGKSSILQAIAMALMTKAQLEKLDLDPNDFIKNGKKEAKVIIWSYEQDAPIVFRIEKKFFYSENENALTFVLGYGSTRLLPKGNILPDFKKESFHNVRNLFDYSTSLNDPNLWLSNVSAKEFKNRIVPVFCDVLDLDENDSVTRNSGKLVITHHGSSAELEDNSEGFKSSLALVADIMQTLSIDKANYHNSYGVVLLDELGNHLHPRWRMRIVSALRKAFPKLQFIVSTHEPLCLHGVSHGEVVVLARDLQKKVIAIDHTLLPDHTFMRVDQLLTSDHFGLISAYNEETERTYKEYYSLLSKGSEDRTDGEQIRVNELSSQIYEKEKIGSDPIAQATFRAYTELYADRIKQEGFVIKEDLKKETVDKVKSIFGSTNNSLL